MPMKDATPDEGARGRPLTVAERKRRQRARLQEAGLTPVQVWIPAAYRWELRRIERLLRRGVAPAPDEGDIFGSTRKDAMDIMLLRKTLDDFTSPNGFAFATLDPADEQGFGVVVEDREEFPIFVSVDDEQLLCLTYLWSEEQVKPERRTELLATLLEMNVPLPLSSFGKIGDRYVLFGALAASASTDDVVTEIEALSDNALEALEVAAPYLN